MAPCIHIEDNVPLPDPAKPETWASEAKTIDPADWSKLKPPAPPASPAKLIVQSNPVRRMPEGCVECYLVGGPLNGQRGPIKGNAKTVEIEVYGPTGDVVSIELYALGDNPTLTFRHHVGSKSP